MIGYRIDKAKGMFFDRKSVLDATDRATRRVLSRFGAYVRRSAKSSIRKRKRASAPGRPPSSHTGLLKKLIFFGYEPTKRSVVIGPVRLSGKPGDAPHVLEHGGTARIARRRWRRGRRVSVTQHRRIAARPFMGPAMEKEQPKLPAMWADSVK
jgi:hypothetical protein